ncbi:MAG: DUF308 domain-containing protein [Bacteroidota bacterium]|nr:MAG: DUF308 domain-containing protein [Bacteroidota bacterium]
MNNLEVKLFKNWWLLAIKGLLTLAFGLLALTLKDINQIKIIKFFCIIILVSGALLIYGSFYNRKRKDPWIWWLFEGLFDFIIGALIFYIIVWHRLAAIAMFTEIIAIWALVFGIIQIITSFRFIIFSLGWFAMLLSGLLAIVYTIIISLSLLPGTHAKTAVIGIFAMFLGIVILINSISLLQSIRKHKN